MTLTPLQKLTKNGEDWGKLIVAKGFKKLPKVQNIAQSGHTGLRTKNILFFNIMYLKWLTIMNCLMCVHYLVKGVPWID